MVAAHYWCNYTYRFVHRTLHENTVEYVLRTSRLLYKLCEASPFYDGVVIQLVEVACKDDRRIRELAKQLAKTRLNVIEQ